MYASTSELARLCRVLGEEFPGAFYAPHHRSYGFKALESYAEMLGLGRDTGCPIRKYNGTVIDPYLKFTRSHSRYSQLF